MKDTSEPELLFANLKEETYQSELALLDRYHTFSAELLRIALLGLAAFGFILKEIFAKIDWSKASCWLCSSRASAVVVVGAFGISAACALWHRFQSTEGARFFFYALRLNTSLRETAAAASQASGVLVRERDQWLAKRETSLERSSKLKYMAVMSLVVASIALAWTFLILLLQWPLPSALPSAN